MHMTLFVLNRLCQRSLASCLAMMDEQDGLLLIEEATYLAGSSEQLKENPQARHVDNPPDASIFVLKEDLVTRGISAKIPAYMEKVGYAEFVDLTLTYRKVVNW